MTPEVLLGFGGNVDVEITWDDAVLTRLAAEHGIAQRELDTEVEITDERSLVISILAFVQAGQGGERFVADGETLGRFPEQFARRWTLGGTGIRAALTLRTLGVPSMVHLVSTNPIIRELLPTDVHRLSSATEDSLHPHLIVQFPRGARVRTERLDVTAPKANRLIYVNDPPNRDLVLSDKIDDVAPHLRVLLVTGLNSMQDPALVEDRLHRIAQVVDAMPDGGVVLFEDAGQHVAALGERVLATMARLADVVSMNEDELFGHLGRTFDLNDATAVGKALREARERIGVRTLVVHTQHWAAAAGPFAHTLVPALRSGVVAAGTRYLVGDGATQAHHEATAQLPVQPSAAEVAAALESETDLVCVPALHLTTDTPTTIGLGDTFIGGLVAALTTDRTALLEGTHR
ncbi:ADP-dependent glucokinase/phosphofructokinase [Ruania alba]|uniref:ADP-dependent phosphofructokinase/glucokinase n=1 Tax=Ruania alba TaxID=648782 RepID=A0A1H5ESG5_9MICO|nr:ADP-dependent glucokinase/phosphofructokinase [Ruania alba]SED94052.1 ADP-dependent phosphofructokinase/glucokinase [Ruania alba]